MDSLPPVLLDFISIFRPLLRAEVFESFTYLLCGLLIGEAKHGTVRASVFAPAAYQPQRLSDLFCRHKLSRQALMAQLTEQVLTILYPSGLPARLFWLADSTLTEEPLVRRGGSGGLFPRAKGLFGGGQPPARPVLRLCGPLIPDGAAAVGQRPGRRLALCQRTVHPTVGGGPRPAVASARAGAAGVGGRSGHRQSSLSPVLGPPGAGYPGTGAFKSGLLLRAAPSTQAGPASELWTEVPCGPVGETFS